MRVMRFVSLVCCALVFGLTLSHVLQAPGSRGLDGPTWLLVQHTFYGGFAVVGGFAEILGVVAATTLALLLRRSGASAPLPPLVAALCLLGTLAAYGFGNRPVNAKVAGWTAASLPPDWSSYRDQWEAAHAVSAALAGIALLVLVASTIWGGERSEPGSERHVGADREVVPRH